jgi:hypothetical protein
MRFRPFDGNFPFLALFLEKMDCGAAGFNVIYGQVDIFE